MARILYLTQIDLEPGAVRLLRGECDRIGIRRPLVVTDAGVRAAGVLQPALDDAYLLPKAAAARSRDVTRRRPDPAEAGRPDWHNKRAALLLAIEDAIEKAPDGAMREALMARLRATLEPA